MLDKVIEGAVARVERREPTLRFAFPAASRLAPPVLPFDSVCFSYSGKPSDYLYRDLNFGIDMDSRQCSGRVRRSSHALLLTRLVLSFSLRRLLLPHPNLRVQGSRSSGPTAAARARCSS